jgi:hypothetical protein
MPLPIDLKKFGGGQRREPESNTRPSPSSQVNVPNRQPPDAHGAPYGAPPHYQPVGPPGEFHQSPHAHFRMSSEHSAQLPPPPDYWYSRGPVVDSSWKLVSSPLVTKKAQGNGKDGKIASKGVQQSGRSQEQFESLPDISPLRSPTNNYYNSAGPQIMAASSLRKTSGPPPDYVQGPYPPFYLMPPPHEHTSSTQYRPDPWQYPPHPYPTYPPAPPGYELSPYPPYPVPPYSNVPQANVPQSPALPGHNQYGASDNKKKRPLPPLFNNVPVGPVPPQQQSQPHPTIRRKRKMYSDFVGVTYNKAHAKYQACITHYRKQHYLGRYKLAVDAALAYDESAKLLKGPNWKINFPTREAYEQARMEEMQHIGRIGDKVTDIDESKAAALVASKMAKIAADLRSLAKEEAVKPTGKGLSNAPQNSGKACYGSSKDKGGAVVRFKRPLDGTSMKKSGGKKTPFATLHTTDDVVEGMSKVTPCQLELEGLPPTSSELDSTQQPSQTIANKDNRCDETTATFAENTPLPKSPDPTRHVQGVENSTPESAIKPKVLQYQRDDIKRSAPECTSSIPKTETKKSTPRSKSKLPVSNTRDQSAASILSTQDAPTIMKNGTLVAASALMTLLGREKSEES